MVTVSVAIGIIVSLFFHLQNLSPPPSPSLISLAVSVDVQHHVYLSSLMLYAQSASTVISGRRRTTEKNEKSGRGASFMPSGEKDVAHVVVSTCDVELLWVTVLQ